MMVDDERVFGSTDTVRMHAWQVGSAREGIHRRRLQRRGGELAL